MHGLPASWVTGSFIWTLLREGWCLSFELSKRNVGSNAVKIVKDILFLLLLLLASFEWHVHVIMIAFPVAGGEYHLVFAYSQEGGRVDVAYHVFTVYVLASIAFAALMLIIVKRFHWTLIGASAALFPNFRFWGIYDFDYASTMFREAVFPLLLALVPLVMLGTYVCACLLEFLRTILREFKGRLQHK